MTTSVPDDCQFVYLHIHSFLDVLICCCHFVALCISNIIYSRSFAMNNDVVLYLKIRSEHLMDKL